MFIYRKWWAKHSKRKQTNNFIFVMVLKGATTVVAISNTYSATRSLKLFHFGYRESRTSWITNIMCCLLRSTTSAFFLKKINRKNIVSSDHIFNCNKTILLQSKFAGNFAKFLKYNDVWRIPIYNIISHLSVVNVNENIRYKVY